MVSTLILARLLTPADFGVVAMAMVVVGLIEVFGETGLECCTFRHPDPQRSDFDTIWTLRLMLGVTLAAVIFLLAPVGADFFGDSRVENTLRLLALRPLLGGLENPGMVIFRRGNEFRQGLRVPGSEQGGVVRGDGDARRHAAELLGAGARHPRWRPRLRHCQSYRMHPFRPRFGLRQAGMAWNFSFWVLFFHLLSFFSSRLDELIIGRIKSATIPGLLQYRLRRRQLANPRKSCRRWAVPCSLVCPG